MKGKRFPRAKSLKKLKDTIRAKTKRNSGKMPSGDHWVVESDVAWLVWVLQTQLQDDVHDVGRLDSDEAAKHPPKTTRPSRSWPRYRIISAGRMPTLLNSGCIA